jgi:hypothetical protein
MVMDLGRKSKVHILERAAIYMKGTAFAHRVSQKRFSKKD